LNARGVRVVKDDVVVFVTPVPERVVTFSE